MGKKTTYTKITPLPVNVPRQLALDMLHSHVEVIELNPLVTGVKSVDAPRDAAADEYFSQWYEISEIITWGFGLKKKIAFKGVFHDQPWGLQTHVYAPMGVDMRNRYSIGGNQPGEPREARELGLDIPVDGLYLREDVEIICAVPLTTGFVKKEAMAATGVMVQRLTRKAELLDEGKLHAMFEQGLLKTAKPNMLPTFADRSPPTPGDFPSSPTSTNGFAGSSIYSPATDSKGFGRYHDIAQRNGGHSKRDSYAGSYQTPNYNATQPLRSASTTNIAEVHEMPASMYQPQNLYPPPLRPHPGSQQFGASQTFTAELPGDNTMLAPPLRDSFGSSSATSSSGLGSPPTQYAAYSPPQPLQQSAQPSPTYPPRNSSYTPVPTAYEAKPDAAQHPANRNSSIESSRHSYTSRDSRGSLEPDHAQFAGLNIRNASRPIAKPGSAGSSNTVSKCPVCGLFEGDESAVTHHVSRTHFS